MNSTFTKNFKTPEESKLWAQMIAFAPVAFQVARCLRELGILKCLLTAPEGLTAAGIQAQVDLSAYGLGVLLDGGESCGLVQVDDGRYTITLAGSYLETDALTRVNMNFTHDVCYQGLFSLEQSLRKQSPEGLKVFGQWPTIYEGLTELPPAVLKSWLEFDHFYSDDAFPKALPYVFRENPKTILDVGGNTGKFAMACARYHPDVRVTILDYPQQLGIAEDQAKQLGLQDRIHFQPTRLLDHSVPFPKGFDVIWMSQFLDCFSKDDVLALMTRAREAMSESSHLFIMEPFVDRQKYEAAKFCLDMTSPYFTAIANGKSRMYRATEFIELASQAGLEVIDECSLRLSHTILKCKKVP